MSAFTVVNPEKLKPMAGKAVVRIIEILGGTTEGGIYVPGTLQDHAGKDTFYGEMIRLGPAPRLKHYKSGPGPGWDVRENSTGKVWPPEVMEQFKEGDIFVFPRDVEMVFTWDNQRFCIVHIHEAIIGLARDEFNAQGFEMVAWKPPGMPGEGGDPDANKSAAELLDELEEGLYELERDDE